MNSENGVARMDSLRASRNGIGTAERQSPRPPARAGALPPNTWPALPRVGHPGALAARPRLETRVSKQFASFGI